MEEVEEICNKLLIIDHGQIILSGTTDEIKALYKNKQNIDSIISIRNPRFCRSKREPIEHNNRGNRGRYNKPTFEYILYGKYE